MNTHPAAERSNAAPPPRPTIEGLTPYDEVDLDKLGDEDLVFYITYDTIGPGQIVRVEWIGADEHGVASSFEGAVDIDDNNFDPKTLRARISVSNRFVVAATNGYAFVAFEPMQPALEPSLRAFCFVGVRPRRLEHMPVAQAPQSHNLFIDPSSLGGAGATFLVPAYQAMQAKDKVTLTFVGFESDGTEDTTWSRTTEVGEQDVGKVLRWQVPPDQFAFLGGGRAEVHYEIAFADLPATLTAPMQTFRIDPIPVNPPPLLPQLEIDGYSSGPLDPEKFPNGLVLRVPANEELMVSDWVLLNFNEVLGEQQLRIDLSCLESGVIAFNLPAERLRGLASITLGYQVAREGVAYRATERQVDLVVRREDAPLKVLFAESEGSEAGVSAYLPASKALSGALIDLSDIELAASETLEVYWEGRSALGNQKFTFSTIPTEPLVIPAAAVAANMELGDTSLKRFPVYYRILPVGHESQKLHLRILPLARSSYPTLQCYPRRDTEIHLADIVGPHADLTLASWPFMSEKQRLGIILKGARGGANVFFTIRDEMVSQPEVEAKLVTAKVLKTTLESLDDDSPLVFTVSIAFEGDAFDDSWTLFPEMSLTLRK
ncbi:MULTISPECIES: hypothetical protein [unclassified Pseudomonas]|uniref:hypothetical protein n=1 Tax=unclassified Pseudomonas TaxID=196821 RepID=UPI00224AC38A|nr:MULTISPECIES: hypothetical protein [unclassified Pseudomonas]MCX2891034.1 hypothetical protein [Pseudomonas sp. DCB_BI]MDH4550630.1 hypothetical protein [Pseudomonas sp. BN607]